MFCSLAHSALRAKAWLFFLWIFFQPALCLADEAQSQILNEVIRLQELIKEAFSTDEKTRERAQNHDKQLEEVKSQLKSGYLYAGLRRLESIRRDLFPSVYVRRQAQLVEEGLQAVEGEWRAFEDTLRQKEKSFSQNKRPGPIAIKALAEVSMSQSRPYYESSRPLGMNTSPQGWLYYLGRAHACVDFAFFCQELSFEPVPPKPTFLPLTERVADLESRLVQGYQNKGFGEEEKEKRYNRFLAANVAIKMVRELEEAHLNYGSVYKFLESLMNFELIDRPVGNAGNLTSLLEVSRQTKARLTSSEVDHSLGLLFWQMAQSELDRAEHDSSDGAALTRATVILETVLPSYFEIVEQTD